MIGKITKQSVERLRPGGEWLWDTVLQGFGARRQVDGAHYALRYRVAGKQRIMSIGRHGVYAPDRARNEARRLLGLIATGGDPLAEKRRPAGLAAEVERYLERKRPQMKPRTFTEVERHLRHLHDHNGDIDRRAIATILGEIESTSGPVARNRTRSSLSAFFKWTIAEGLRETNPVAGTAKAPEASRDRVLSDAELAKVWRSASGRYGDIVRLLILTGQRRDEIGALRWSEITDGAIVLPPERTKNSRQHMVPLAPAALTIINRQPRRTGRDLIFGDGQGGFSGWGVCKMRLDAAVGLAPWRLHDLRRTAATGMAELGVLPHIIEAVLNHVSGHRAGVAGIYNRARYEGEMRDALAKWASYVERL
jgi:integrase